MTLEEKVLDRESAVLLLQEAKKRVRTDSVLIYIRFDTRIVSAAENRNMGFIGRYFRKMFGCGMTERERRLARRHNGLTEAGGV